MSGMRRSEEFRQRAEQMERSAQAAVLPLEREGYLRIAEAYRRLAADAADLEAVTVLRDGDGSIADGSRSPLRRSSL